MQRIHDKPTIFWYLRDVSCLLNLCYKHATNVYKSVLTMLHLERNSQVAIIRYQRKVIVILPPTTQKLFWQGIEVEIGNGG
jgi:hypothetical protein